MPPARERERTYRVFHGDDGWIRRDSGREIGREMLVEAPRASKTVCGGEDGAVEKPAGGKSIIGQS
jgi:hypothetical protein